MKKFGPALLVTAAFIGPGTVTTASIAGANYGYALVWALAFSVLATFVLQEMASRLGLVTGKGLAEALRESIQSPVGRTLAMLLVIAAIGLGNAAYQAGNLTGAALGVSSVTGGTLNTWVWLLGIAAGVLLWLGKYKVLEKVLISLVGLMSLVFIVTMIMAGVDFSAMFRGLFSPHIPAGATLSVIALIGTTVVPYNLFLHASIVASNKDNNTDETTQLRDNRIDAGLSIGLGGLVTLAVMSCAASAFFANQTQMDVSNIASQLEPLLGQNAKYFFALGLFAAGLTSAITAPLAAAYAVTGAMGWQVSLQDMRFKAVWLIVLISGVAFASLGIKPILAILFAQAANGLLLPIIAVFLIWIMNQNKLLGEYKNSLLSNLFSGIVVLFVSLLGLYKVWSLF